MHDDHVQPGNGDHCCGAAQKEVQVVVGSLTQTGNVEDSIADLVGNADDGHEDGHAEEDIEPFGYGIQPWLMVPLLDGLLGDAQDSVEEGDNGDDDHVHSCPQQSQPEFATF